MGWAELPLRAMSKQEGPLPAHILGGRATANAFAKKHARRRRQLRKLRERGGLTWDEIGRVMGISKQAARAMYKRHFSTGIGGTAA